MFKTYTLLEDATHSQPRVTALLACQDNLMPASWHMPISKSPFRYAVGVRPDNYTHKLIQEHNSFTLNFLPIEHFEIVNLMGKMHGDIDDKLKLSHLHIEGKDTFNNILLGASDFIYECIVTDTYVNGDHTIFIVDIINIHVNEKQSGEPILFSGRGKYGTVTDTILASNLKSETHMTL